MKTSHFSTSNYDFSSRHIGETTATAHERSVHHLIQPKLNLIDNCENDVTITSTFKQKHIQQTQHQPKGASKRKRESGK